MKNEVDSAAPLGGVLDPELITKIIELQRKAHSTRTSFEDTKSSLKSMTIQWNTAGIAAAGLGLMASSAINLETIETLIVQLPMLFALMSHARSIVGRFRANSKLS